MKLLPLDATDDDLLALCRDWAELVAAGQVQTALDLLWIPPEYDGSQRWTPATLLLYVENYGSWEPMRDGSKWRITSLAAAQILPSPGFTPRADVVRLVNDPRAGSVELDLPLNDQWGDLTAQFEFRRVGPGIAVSLYDLHVL